MSQGLTRIAIDKPTRAKLHELAGDMPLSHYLRGIAFGSIKPDGGAQTPLPGQERLVSRNTLASVSAEVNALAAEVKALATMRDINERRYEAMLVHIGKCVEFNDKQALQELREFIIANDKIRKVETASERQTDLRFEPA
jgi:hypothetical protein